jgi:hypothetical protein
VGHNTRRGYLSGASGFLAVLAGCSGDSRSTTTDTWSGTETSPTTSSFEINRAVPLYTWYNYGDIDQYPSDTYGLGAYATIAVEAPFEMPADGPPVVTYRTELLDGNQVIARNERHESPLPNVDAEPGTTTTVDVPHFVVTTDAPGTGEYTVRCSLRDVVANTNFDRVEETISLVEPFSSDEVRVSEVRIPDTVSTDESFRFRIFFENTTTRASSIISPLSGRRPGGDFRQISDIRVSFPSEGGNIFYQLAGNSFSDPGVYTFRIDELGKTFDVTVER